MSRSLWHVVDYEKIITPEQQIGRLVYPHSQPQTVGIVRAIKTTETKMSQYKDPNIQHMVEVEWPDGSRTWTWNMHAMDYQSLIDDHEKKLRNHRLRAEKARASYSKTECNGFHGPDCPESHRKEVSK